MPAFPWQIRARILDKYPSLKNKETSLNVLLSIDDGREVGFDGEDNGGAVEYFENLCLSRKRDPVLVLNWYAYTHAMSQAIPDPGS